MVSIQPKDMYVHGISDVLIQKQPKLCYDVERRKRHRIGGAPFTRESVGSCIPVPAFPRRHVDIPGEHQSAPRLCAGRAPLRSHPAAGAGHGQAGAVRHGARGPGPAPGFRGLQRAARALQPAQHRQDRRRAEPLRQQAAVTPARQPGQDLHHLLRHERGQRGLERLHLRLNVALRTPPPQARSPRVVFCPPRPQRPHLPGRRNKRYGDDWGGGGERHRIVLIVFLCVNLKYMYKCYRIHRNFWEDT